MSSSKPIGVGRVNRWTRNSPERLENYYYEALAFSQHNIDLVFDEETMKPERLTEAPKIAGIDPEVNFTKKQLAKMTTLTFHLQIAWAMSLLERCGKNKLDVCMFPCRMVSTLQWSRLETIVSPQSTCRSTATLPLWSVARMCCSSQVSPCVAYHVAWCVARERSTTCTKEPDTARTETERVLTRPLDTPSPRQPSVSSHEKSFAHHPYIDCLILLCPLVLRAQTVMVHLWVDTSRMVAERLVILL